MDTGSDRRSSIPLCEPCLEGNAWAYVKECIDSGWVSSVGAFVDRFERDTAQRVKVQHAVAAVNGTAALHTSLLAVGVMPEDEVLVSDLTFIAPANAVRYAGAWPVFIDAEPAYWQMDVSLVREFLERRCRPSGGRLCNAVTGRRIGAILPVHVLGHPVDLDPLLDLANRYGLPVVEDATEALGSQYKGRPVGGLGRAAVLSFNGNKIITTGGGGMILTNDAETARRAKYLTTQAKDDPLEYVHGEIGYNYRLVNVLAALGCAQMERLDEHIRAKRRIAVTYDRALSARAGLTPMGKADWAQSNDWLYTVLVDPGQYGCDSRGLIRRLSQEGIQARPLWQPMHLSPAHEKAQSVGGQTAERLYRHAVSLPCSVGLTEQDQARVIEAILSHY